MTVGLEILITFLCSTYEKGGSVKGKVKRKDNLKTKQKMDVRKTQKKSKTNDNVNPMTTCNLVRLTIMFLRLTVSI